MDSGSHMGSKSEARSVRDGVADGGRSSESGAQLRAAFESLEGGTTGHVVSTSLAIRRDQLARLIRMLKDNQARIVAAAAEDFGSRAAHETLLADVFTVISSARYARSNLRSWMAPSHRRVAPTLLPGRVSVVPQPLGVVGIIGTWNYPFFTTLNPLVYAIAAGNRALIKPSELAPKSAALIEKMIHATFAPDEIRVVCGGADVATEFTQLRLDHLCFTGSTRVGRAVMRAAAENLTPVTLELGGKSPVLVHPDFPIERAAERIVYGKLLNAGQTCIAPDYLLVQEGREQEAIDAMSRCIRKSYPTLAANVDYTSMINRMHYERVSALVTDAARRGARVVPLHPEGVHLPVTSRKVAPVAVVGVTDEMAIMQEEIFGPVLPIVTYRSVHDAIAYINARPRPLAFYYFDESARRASEVLATTISGGACINDTVLHAMVDDAPFGGVGPSGMGAYHGEEGFRTFSHMRTVFRQSRLNGTALLAPPYGRRLSFILDVLIGR